MRSFIHHYFHGLILSCEHLLFFFYVGLVRSKYDSWLVFKFQISVSLHCCSFLHKLIILLRTQKVDSRVWNPHLLEYTISVSATFVLCLPSRQHREGLIAAVILDLTHILNLTLSLPFTSCSKGCDKLTVTDENGAPVRLLVLPPFALVQPLLLGQCSPVVTPPVTVVTLLFGLYTAHWVLQNEVSST